jgi:nitroimidazol reductase NimA-like FMN-containing flavoprotein (pyridoxamine 5'-phosphate oxidase superfamily)
VRSDLTEAEVSFVRWERVARFASVDAEGQPHVVPICPVLDGDHVVFASEPTAKLRFLRDNPRCAIVWDDYVEDWNLNRQVQVRGRAAIVADGDAWDRGKALLDEKYRQYEPMFPVLPGRTLIVEVHVERVTSEGF